MLLAGLGARVIKIESPTSPDTCRENAPYLGSEGATLARRHPDDVSISAINRLRNKLGVTLNLKHPQAQSVFADLLKKADIVVAAAERYPAQCSLMLRIMNRHGKVDGAYKRLPDEIRAELTDRRAGKR